MAEIGVVKIRENDGGKSIEWGMGSKGKMTGGKHKNGDWGAKVRSAQRQGQRHKLGAPLQQSPGF